MYFLVKSKLGIILQQANSNRYPTFIFNVSSEKIVLNYLKAFIRNSLDRFGMIVLLSNTDFLSRLINYHKLKPITKKNVHLIFDIKEINVEIYNKYKEKSYFYKPNVRQLYGNYNIP